MLLSASLLLLERDLVVELERTDLQLFHLLKRKVEEDGLLHPRVRRPRVPGLIWPWRGRYAKLAEIKRLDRREDRVRILF